MKTYLHWISSLLLATTLIACGGGGDGGESQDNNSNTVNNPNPQPDPDPNPNTGLDEQYRLYLKDLTERHILPNYQLLHEKSQAMASSSAEFCHSQSVNAEHLTALEAAWRALNSQWQTIQWVKVGAIADDNRHYRIQFWPDLQDAVTSGLASLLAYPEQVTSDYLASRNVGGQGIPALEQLIFATGDSALLIASDQAKRCEVLIAISDNLVNISDQVYQAWQPEGGNFAGEIIAGSGEYPDRATVISDLATHWLEHLEIVKDEKVLIPLGTNSPGYPNRTEFPLSDSSLLSIQTNIDTFQQIYTAAGGHGFDDILKEHLQQHSINSEMMEKLATMLEAANILQGQLEALLTTEENRQQLNTLISKMQDFRTILTADFVQALDIYIGFNSNDGD